MQSLLSTEEDSLVSRSEMFKEVGNSRTLLLYCVVYAAYCRKLTESVSASRLFNVFDVAQHYRPNQRDR